EDMADHDPVLPVLNRHGLLRLLGLLLTHGERSGMSGSLVSIHVHGIDEIRAAHGLFAADAAEMHVAHILLNSVRGTDYVGHIDGGLFGVLLTVSEPPGAHWKATDLAQRINAPPFIWQSTLFRLEVTLGVCHFAPDQEPEHILRAAEAARQAGMG
ncbi:MAG: GGDEF domain-containing protein, partial [Rhodospirillales bacterium]|nr:GGDEF domain-containing protein [Rhodospirillales bacterium]